MMNWRQATRTSAVVWWLAFAPATAQADSSRAEQAEQLFREGREAMKRQDYLGACNRFRTSQKLDPAPGTALSIAECEEALGRLAVAHQYYQEVIDQLQTTDERVELARKQQAALEPRMGRVFASNIPPEYPLQIKLYSDSAYSALVPTSPAVPRGVWVVPGEYRILLVVKGKELKVSEGVQVKAGEKKFVEFVATKDQIQESRPVHQAKEQEGLHTGTKVALIGGGAALLGGALWQYGARQRDRALTLCPDYQASGRLDCPRATEANQQLSTSRTWRVTGQILTGAGALSVLVGLLVNASPRAKPKGVLQFEPWLESSVGLSGASMGGTW